MDVKGLYPNIPRREARKAWEEALKNWPNKNLPTSDVLQMIDLVLENNNFHSGQNNYIRTESTAIGAKCNMHYACTYMGNWESQLVNESVQKPEKYLWYVDIFGVWLHGEEALKEFHQKANLIRPRIQVNWSCPRNPLYSLISKYIWKMEEPTQLYTTEELITSISSQKVRTSSPCWVGNTI